MTDHRQSYAAFEYKCGDINWGDDAIIGYKASRRRFEEFELSGYNATQIDCLEENTTILLYNLTQKTPRGTYYWPGFECY